jgi:uncharacterized protein
MTEPDFMAAARYAIGRLERELDPRLRYHSLAHTRDDVLPAAERLAAVSGVRGEPLLLLRTAAIYHDIGFLISRDGHEAAGAAVAAAILPVFGYAPAQVDTIAEIIMSTKIPQSPQTPLAQLLADADLDLLGRDDFLERNSELRAELRAFGVMPGDLAWYREQSAFLAAHRYWTPAARELRDEGKADNIALLLERLAAAERQG